jgi:hypothetical protein
MLYLPSSPPFSLTPCGAALPKILPTALFLSHRRHHCQRRPPPHTACWPPRALSQHSPSCRHRSQCRQGHLKRQTRPGLLVYRSSQSSSLSSPLSLPLSSPPPNFAQHHSFPCPHHCVPSSLSHHLPGCKHWHTIGFLVLTIVNVGNACLIHNALDQSYRLLAVSTI